MRKPSPTIAQRVVRSAKRAIATTTNQGPCLLACYWLLAGQFNLPARRRMATR